MASLTTNMRQIALPNLRQLGERLFNALVRIAEFSPQYRAVLYFNAKSDEDLAKMGMTRADVVNRIFGARMGL